MGQILRDLIVSPEVDEVTYWAYTHEGTIMAMILLVVVVIVAVMIILLVKLIKKGDSKTADVQNVSTGDRSKTEE